MKYQTLFDCLKIINPLKPREISNYNQLDQSMCILKVVGWYFSFLFNF